MNKKQLLGMINLYLNQFKFEKLAIITFFVTSLITIVRAKEILFLNNQNDVDIISAIVDLNSIYPNDNSLKILIWIFPYIIFCVFWGMFLSKDINYEYLITRIDNRVMIRHANSILILILNFLYTIIVLSANIVGCLAVFHKLDINYSMLTYIFIVLYLFNLSLIFLQVLLKEMINSCSKSFFVISILLITYCFLQTNNLQIPFINIINLYKHAVFNHHEQGIRFIVVLSTNVILIISYIIILLIINKNKNFVAVEKENE